MFTAEINVLLRIISPPSFYTLGLGLGLKGGSVAAYTDRCYDKLIHVCALHLYCFLLQLIRISW